MEVEDVLHKLQESGLEAMHVKDVNKRSSYVYIRGEILGDVLLTIERIINTYINVDSPFRVYEEEYSYLKFELARIEDSIYQYYWPDFDQSFDGLANGLETNSVKCTELKDIELKHIVQMIKRMINA